MAVASGCLEYCSRLPVSCMTFLRSKPASQITSVSVGFPYVSVPLLSKISVRQESICSKIPGFLMMIALRAESETCTTDCRGYCQQQGAGRGHSHGNRWCNFRFPHE